MSNSSSSTTTAPRRACLGLFVHRPRWSMTWRGRVVFVMVLIAGLVMGVRQTHDFLAVDAPVKTKALVIEGWVPRYAVTSFVARVQGDYTDIFTTGGPTLADHKSRDQSDTYASVVQARLGKVGVPAAKIHAVPCWIVKRDRTYASAIALRLWCETNHIELKSFNVVTLGPHARRSRLLHEEAFPDDVKIGVIPLVNEEYEADEWWRYSEGVKETVSEAFAYIYARFWFKPE